MENVQEKLKKIDEGFDEDNYTEDKCDICELEGQRRYYYNKYSDGYCAWACLNCDVELNEGEAPTSGENVCTICENLVHFEEGDSDEYNYVKCNGDECDQKIHLNCLLDSLDEEEEKDFIHLYKIWYCEAHGQDSKIEMMDLSDLKESNEFRLYRLLKEKGIEYIYHSNTVRTACTFLSNKGLLSRKTVECRGLDQTSQNSDDDDKSLGIWNDIFFDNIDIHDHLSRCKNKSACINLYGPVLFKFRLEALLELNILSKLKITRTNPNRWIRDNGGKDDFFETIDEMKDSLSKGNFQQHIVLHNFNNYFSLRYLEEIIVDDPKIEDEKGIDIYSQAVGALKNAKRKGRLDYISIVRRTCNADCICNETYSKMNENNSEKFNELFLP